jgi:HEAT repeat protein
MDQTLDAFASALSSGDTDRVNRAIDAVEDLELEERAALFDACFARCRDLYDSEDGYQRQSVVRFMATLYPRLAFRTVGAELTDEALPGDWTLNEIVTHRRRLREFYLTALDDADGRVRRAAVKALKELAVTAEMIGADDELQTMLSEVEALGEDIDDEEIQKHIDQAYENVAFHAEKPGSLLPEGLRDVLE